ncbi:MAG: hypothetical protein FWH50_03255, partial [Coriobacteriia bacterium]|nr:hypothetical protein [Coriobacteriia bacterium]
PPVSLNVSDAEMRAAAKAFVEEFKDCKIMVSYMFMDEDFPGYHPGFQNAVYEYSRLAFQDED